MSDVWSMRQQDKMEVTGVWVCAGVMGAKRTLFFQVETPGIT